LYPTHKSVICTATHTSYFAETRMRLDYRYPLATFSGMNRSDDDSRMQRETRPDAAFYEAAYDVLVQHAGAYPGERSDFVYELTRRDKGYRVEEWRFRGLLGFGGKFWRNRTFYVSCYREDETPERLQIIETVNAALAALVAIHNPLF